MRKRTNATADTGQERPGAVSASEDFECERKPDQKIFFISSFTIGVPVSAKNYRWNPAQLDIYSSRARLDGNGSPTLWGSE